MPRLWLAMVSVPSAGQGRRFRRVRHGFQMREPVPHPGHSLDGEGLIPVQLRHLSHLGDAAVDGVLAHDPATPAGFDQLVAGHNGAVRPGQRHQYLHYPGFHGLGLPANGDFPERWPDLKPSQLEIPFPGQVYFPLFTHRGHVIGASGRGMAWRFMVC